MNIKQKNLFLQQALTENNFLIAEKIQQQFLHYLDLLQQWNQVFNLTAIEDERELVLLHIVDSLVISPYLKGTTILDVGTGAGLPGIPLALVYPEKKFYLLDSNSKKTHFLTQVKIEVQIPNIEIIHDRVENFQPENCFDTILTRAFGSLKEMLQKTEHLICPEGEFLAMKGVYPEKEIQEVPDGFKVTTVHGLRIKGLAVDRCLVCLTKGVQEWGK